MSSQQVPSSLRDILADILEISPDEVTPGRRRNRRQLGLLSASAGHPRNRRGVRRPVRSRERIAELTTVALIQTELEAKGVTL